MTSARVEHADAIIAAFAPRRRRQRVVRIATFGVVSAAWMVLIGCATDRIDDHQVLTWGSFVALGTIAVAVARWRNWRCPSCFEEPGSYSAAWFCQTCGIELRRRASDCIRGRIGDEPEC